MISRLHKLNLGKLLKGKGISNGIIFSIFSILNNGINFLLLLVIANFIEVKAFGELNLFNTYYLLAAIAIPLGTTGYLSISFFKNTTEFKQSISGLIIISTITTILFLTLTLLFKEYFESLIGLSFQIQLLTLGICYIQIFNNIYLEYLRLNERPLSYGFYTLVNAFLNFGLTIILISEFKQGWYGRVNSFFISSMFLSFISIYFLFKNKYITILPPLHKFKLILSFGLPIIPHLASNWIRQGLDRYIINYNYSLVDVANFSYAFSFANIITIIGIAYNASNSVQIFKSLTSNSLNDYTTISKQIKNTILFYLIISILVCIISSIYIYYFSNKYLSSIKYIYILGISSFFQCLYLLYVNYLYYYKKTFKLMVITLSTSFIHMGVSYLITPLSITYTALISAMSSFMIFSLVYIEYIKLTNSKHKQ